MTKGSFYVFNTVHNTFIVTYEQVLRRSLEIVLTYNGDWRGLSFMTLDTAKKVNQC